MPDLVRYDVDVEKAVAVITMNRPEKLNALSVDLIAQFKDVLDTAEEDPQVRAVVIRGEGRMFCAGQDTAELAEGAMRAADDQREASFPRPGAPLPIRLHRFTKPTVAAMHAAALGAGLDVALACDYRIAEESCRMGDWHVLRGYIPSASLYFLPRLVGVTKALEMVSFGTIVQGEEAASLGLVTKVVPDKQAFDAAMELADQLSRGPQSTLQHIKRLIWEAEQLDLESAMERVGFARAAAAPAKEGLEGMQAYSEKRPADWRAAARKG